MAVSFRGTYCPYITMGEEQFGYMDIVSPTWSLQNEANAWTDCGSDAPREWRLGQCRERLALTQYGRLGLTLSLIAEYHPRLSTARPCANIYALV